MNSELLNTKSIILATVLPTYANKISELRITIENCKVCSNFYMYTTSYTNVKYGIN